MRFVFLLENEPKFEKEIAESIYQIDPKIQLKVFKSLEAFAAWIKVFMQNGPQSVEGAGEYPQGVFFEPLAKGDKHTLALVISKVEFLGAEQLGLLRKTRDMFIQRGLCTKEDPTGFVLTVFDDPNYHVHDLQDNILNNILYKPFDRLILTQHLTYAIDGRHPPSKYTIANQKTTAIVEMLKELKLESMSEIGFRSISDREIPVGVISKYYAGQFISDRHLSLMGVTRSCKPHPSVANHFQVEVQYFAVDPIQIQNLRKDCFKSYTSNPDGAWFQNVSDPTATYTFIGVDPDEMGPAGLFAQINRRFKNVNHIDFENFADFMAELDPEASLKQGGIFGKSFGGKPETILRFDKTGNMYLGVDDKAQVSTLFGKPPEEWKNKTGWMPSILDADSKENFKKIFKPDGGNQLLVLSAKSGEEKFLVYVTKIEPLDKEIKVSLKELTDSEKAAFLKKVSKIPAKVDFLIISHRYAGDKPVERWGPLLEALEKKTGKKPLLFLSSKKDYTDNEERDISAVFHDIWFKPVDKVYMFQKLKMFFPTLADDGEPIQLHPFKTNEIIKSANPIKVIQISEAGFIMQYNRAIQIGKFREMVLLQPYEIGSPELKANCNFSEAKGKEGFDNHFVFFGMNDQFLKHIRQWILTNYVQSKEKG